MADMVSVNDLGPGRNFIDDNGDIYTVLDISHNKTAMAKMKVKVKVRNLRSGVIKELQFFSNLLYSCQHERKIILHHIINNCCIKVKVMMCYDISHSHCTFPINFRIFSK